MRWNHTRSGKFEVRSYYKLLSSRGVPDFPCRSVWQAKVPHKVAFFTWLAALGKNITIDNLHRRKVCILDWCFMCKRAGETGEHLCEYVRELWSMLFCIFGIHWVMPNKVSALLACWRRNINTRQNLIWDAIPSCLMWLIWRERNHRAFEDSERHSSGLEIHPSSHSF